MKNSRGIIDKNTIDILGNDSIKIFMGDLNDAKRGMDGGILGKHGLGVMSEY